jgi:hypothetical protein
VPTLTQRIVAPLLLIVMSSGCVTTTMISQPSFWDTCGEKENCGPVVAGVLGGEILLYGVVAGVAALTAKRDEPAEEASAEPEEDAPAVEQESEPKPEREEPEDPPRPKRWPGWP